LTLESFSAPFQTQLWPAQEWEMKNGHGETPGRQTKIRKTKCILHEFLQWSNLNGKNELKSGLFIYFLA